MIKYLLYGNSAFHKILLQNAVGMNMFSVNPSLQECHHPAPKMGYWDIKTNDILYKSKALRLTVFN